MADGLRKLVGDNLQGKEGTVQTSAFAEKKVGLYFSAHWCPPCRGFTPKLAQWYNDFKKSPRAEEMEMIFVSSDKDQEKFDEYYGEMPWHALPFSDREMKSKLSKKFKVSGIPTLLVLDADSGDVITKNGRAKVTESDSCDKFPWYPKKVSDMMCGPIKTKNGEEDIQNVLCGKIRAIYFSAHWCPPCRAFTPQLVDCYNKLKAVGKKFEILFASWDRSEEAFEAYYKEMPWVTFPYQDPRAKDLSDHFEVEGIPSLIILDEDNNVITKTGRAAMSADPEGKEFPWHPKPLNRLTAIGAGMINEAPAVIYLSSDLDDEKEQKSRTAMNGVAEKYFADRKDKPDMEEVNFFYECKDSDDLPNSLRGFANLGENPMLLLLNIPDQEKYVIESDDLTEAQVEEVISKFKAGTLQCKPLRG